VGISFLEISAWINTSLITYPHAIIDSSFWSFLNILCANSYRLPYASAWSHLSKGTDDDHEDHPIHDFNIILLSYRSPINFRFLAMKELASGA